MANGKTVLTEQIGQLTGPVLQEQGYELVDIQYVPEHGQQVLRFLVDKAGGITLDDCATISDQVGRLLDASDLLKQRYALEVSSPGLNRPLKKESDYARFIGERVDVKLYAPLQGRRNFKGSIQSVGAGVVVVEESPGIRFSLPLVDVAKARLDPEIDI